MGTKTVKYNKQGINQLPNDKPVLYRIKTESGNLNYVGIAQRGRVRGENLRASERNSRSEGPDRAIQQYQRGREERN